MLGIKGSILGGLKRQMALIIVINIVITITNRNYFLNIFSVCIIPCETFYDPVNASLKYYFSIATFKAANLFLIARISTPTAKITTPNVV